MIVGNCHSQGTSGAPARLVRAAAYALLAGGLFSCQTYRPISQATIERGSSREYAKLLVITRDGYEIELAHAFIRADSVVGLTAGKEQRRMAYPHDRIVRIESLERSTRRTVEEATALPSGADGGEIGRGIICALTMTFICIPPPTR